MEENRSEKGNLFDLLIYVFTASATLHVRLLCCISAARACRGIRATWLVIIKNSKESEMWLGAVDLLTRRSWWDFHLSNFPIPRFFLLFFSPLLWYIIHIEKILKNFFNEMLEF